MRKTAFLLIFGFTLFFQNCCGWVKEEDLGKNLKLTEYDNIDRRILYSEERCSGTGIEIVPMTVTAYANDSKWIIAKTRTSRFGTEFQYWIINKDFKIETTQKENNLYNTIKLNVSGPLDSTTFQQLLKKHRITLKLKNI